MFLVDVNVFDLKSPILCHLYTNSISQFCQPFIHFCEDIIFLNLSVISFVCFFHFHKWSIISPLASGQRHSHFNRMTKKDFTFLEEKKLAKDINGYFFSCHKNTNIISPHPIKLFILHTISMMLFLFHPTQIILRFPNLLKKATIFFPSFLAFMGWNM